MKKQLWILLLAVGVSLVGCISQENNKQPISSVNNTTIEPSPSAQADEELTHQVLLDQLTYDWNKDGEDDDIRLIGSDDPAFFQTIAVEVNGQTKIELTEQQHEMSGYVRFGKWINLGPNQQGLTVVFDGVDAQEPTEAQPAHRKHYAWVILKYEDDKLSVVLDSLSQPYLSPGNITLTYNGKGDLFTFKDHFYRYGSLL